MEKLRNGLMLIKDSGSISLLSKSSLNGIIMDLMEFQISRKFDAK